MAAAALTVLILSALGVIMLVLSKIPKVMARPVGRARIIVAADSFVEYFWQKARKLGGWLWSFVLEAKDIRPASMITGQVDKVKKVFRVRIKQSESDPDWMPEVAAQTVEKHEEAVSRENKTAEELYLETIRKDPNNQPAYEALGRLYLQEKNYKAAVEVFRYLTRLERARDIYWSNLGISLYSTRDYQGAIAAYEQAIKINGKVPTRWINLALCFEAVDDHNRSVRAMGKALELDPRNINYLMLLADIYSKVGNKVRGEEVLTQVLAIDPTHKAARERLMKLKI
jgi:tetratricopeptide (TPR) repeat protein